MMNRLIALLVVILLLLGGISSAFLKTKKVPSWYDIYTKQADMAKGWKYIVIHHSGTDSGNAEAFDAFHTEQGYGGLCYHFVIGNGNGSPDGKVEEGFRWKEQMAGTHVDVNSWYHNIFGIGICLVGNFEKAEPTEKQMKALTQLVKKLAKAHSIPGHNIMGHSSVPLGDMDWDADTIQVTFEKGKYAPTICPGRKFSMDRLKEMVFSKQDVNEKTGSRSKQRPQCPQHRRSGRR